MPRQASHSEDGIPEFSGIYKHKKISNCRNLHILKNDQSLNTVSDIVIYFPYKKNIFPHYYCHTQILNVSYNVTAEQVGQSSNSYTTTTDIIWNIYEKDTGKHKGPFQQTSSMPHYALLRDS